MQYFSTLERLRFAHESCLIDGISQHYDDITNFRRQKHRQGRSASDHLAGRFHQDSDLDSQSPSLDLSPSETSSSDAADEAGFGPSQQAAPARRVRASVILDAADEAVYRLHQQASRRNLSRAVSTLSPPPSPGRESMASRDGQEQQSAQPGDGQVPQSFLDSFRWLDEEEDLDLRLFLDDYHANLREGTPTTNQRPSFRRHLSISKIPFGRRNSVSSTTPATKEAAAPALRSHSSTGSVSNPPTHTRRRSRALSLIAPKHAPQPSIPGIDPAAAHYQDPEARLKLRVYLASPQKFDEAVEFGFPSSDISLDADGAALAHRQLKQQPTDGASTLRTFLADDDDDNDDDDDYDGDNLSLNSDQPSLADPESPKTPEPFEHRVGGGGGGARHARLVSTDTLHGRDFVLAKKGPEAGCGYVQAPAGSREMTLRMTLTRPDLRSHEDEIYGWQQQQQQAYYQQHSRRPSGLVLPAAAGAFAGDGSHHREGLPGFDCLIGGATAPAEKGVMKRIWNRVRRV